MQQEALKVYLDTIKALILEDQINEAYNALVDLDSKVQAGIENDVLLITSNYRMAAKMQEQRRITFDQFTIEAANAKHGLLELMKTVPDRVELNAKIKGLSAYQFSVPDEAKLERFVGTNNLLRIKWLEDALKASKAVCIIKYIDVDGFHKSGTGFLTKEGDVFTNNHVLRTQEVVQTASLEFNYEIGADGKIKPRTVYQLDASTHITSPPNELDFARVKVIDRPEAPLSQWGFLEFETEPIPQVGEGVTIIQHPKGEDKQIALNANEVIGQMNQHLFYETDTDEGSSGSPVFNKHWKVVAIHHAGKITDGGMVINAQGDKRPANRGILFRDIFAFIGQ